MNDVSNEYSYTEKWDVYCAYNDLLLDYDELKAENTKLRDELERIQPTDCEGNVIGIADTVHMFRSEHDGDHEWDDVVVELVNRVGNRWIVRGSKGEAWACDCTKTGHDDAVFDASGDALPLCSTRYIENVADFNYQTGFTYGKEEGIREVGSRLFEMRQLVIDAHRCKVYNRCCEDCRTDTGECPVEHHMRELGIEAE